MRRALARHPGAPGGLGALAVYETPAGPALVREDAEQRPVAALVLAPTELEALASVLELAAVALRPRREDVPAHEGEFAEYDALLERRRAEDVQAMLERARGGV